MRIKLIFSFLVALLVTTSTGAQEALPQTPVVIRQTTDVYDLSLKGNVNSLIQYRNVLNSNFTPPGKLKEHETFFDKYGAKIKEILYHFRDKRTRVSESRTFGYVDGFRAANITTTEPQPTPRSSYDTDAPKDPPVPDKRFHAKFQFEYDPDGHLSEIRQYDNLGRLEWQENYAYEENKKITAGVYPSGSEFKYKTEEIFDDKGNVIREINTYYDKENEKPYIFIIKYLSFDKENNWTRRSLRLKQNRRPYVYEYRTIAYYKITP